MKRSAYFINIGRGMTTRLAAVVPDPEIVTVVDPPVVTVVMTPEPAP